MASSVQVSKHDRRSIERILANCEVYLRCELVCYDEKLHASVNRAIGLLEDIEEDLNVPDDVLPAVADRHLELLAMRMKLLSLNQKPVVDNPSATKSLYDLFSRKGKEEKKEPVSSVKQEKKQTSSFISNLPPEGKTIRPQPDDEPIIPVVNLIRCSAKVCVFCDEKHIEELCSFPLNKKMAILKKKKLCFKCLASIKEKEMPHHCNVKCTICPGSHHVSICRTQAKQMKKENSLSNATNTPSTSKTNTASLLMATKPPIKEPSLPNQSQLRLPAVVHPRSMFISLISCVSPNSNKVVYTPTISVEVLSPSGSEMARAYINFSTATNSIVSPLLLAKLGIEPTLLPSPITVQASIGGSFQVKYYAILEISSLYKNYRYKRLFYVHDLTHHSIEPATDRVKKICRERCVTLSNELHLGSMRLDLLIGLDQCDLTAFQMNQQLRVSLGDEDNFHVSAYYTHFGYLLMGTEMITKDRGNKFGATALARPVTSSSSNSRRLK